MEMDDLIKGELGPRSAESAMVAWPRRREDLVVEAIDDDLLLFDPVTANTHLLNTTGREIWRLCDGAHSPEGMALELCRRFEVMLPDARRHTGELIVRLRDEGLLSGG